MALQSHDLRMRLQSHRDRVRMDDSFNAAAARQNVVFINRAYTTWVSPPTHVDALVAGTVQERLTDLIEKQFNKVKMPGKQRHRLSRGTVVYDYGQNVTLGKQPYTDWFKGIRTASGR